MFYFLLIIFCLLLVLHLYFRYGRAGRLLHKIPGPTGLPIIGNLLMFTFASSDKLWLLGEDIVKVWYPISKVFCGPIRCVLIQHPDDVEKLLNSPKHIEKGRVYTFLHAWLKTGLLTSSGEKWRKRRKVLTPAFHFNILQKYISVSDKEGLAAVKNLMSDGDESIQELLSFCSRSTLNVICESAMDVKLDKMENEALHKYIRAIHDMGTIITYRMTKPYVTNAIVDGGWIPIGRLQRQALEILHGFSDKVITEREAYHEKTNYSELECYSNEKNSDSSDDSASYGRKKKLSMLDLLLSAKRDNLIDRQGIQEEVDTFMFEGHDTTGEAMVFALILLAENKVHQDTARKEINEVLEESGGKLGMKELQKLDYLERCIKESLRLFPSVPIFSRTIREELSLSKYVVPANTEVFVFSIHTHRDPNFWSEPDKFDPDRFLPENSKGRHPFAYIPFSAGPRNCIGQKFALMELKLLIARILHNFYIEPLQNSVNITLTADLVIRPNIPIYAKFVKIKK